MNHAAELYTVDIGSGNITQLTHVNDQVYNNLQLCKTERRFVTTTDGKQMLVWVIYPPGFDASKKYPTLLYCQGGPPVRPYPDLFFPLEFPVNGLRWLRRRGTEPARHARSWHEVERRDQ